MRRVIHDGCGHMCGRLNVLHGSDHGLDFSVPNSRSPADIDSGSLVSFALALEFGTSNILIVEGTMFWNRPQQPGEVRKRMKAIQDGEHYGCTSFGPQMPAAKRKKRRNWTKRVPISITERQELALLLRAVDMKVALPMIDGEVN